MGKKEEAKTVYEKLRQELGEKEADLEIESIRKNLRRLFGWVSWEDAVLYLAEKKGEEKKAKEPKKPVLEYEGAFLEYEGEHFKIYYYRISSFVDELSTFGKFLEGLEENGEEILAIVPNIGAVPASIVLDGFQGVKGFAVIARKPNKNDV